MRTTIVGVMLLATVACSKPPVAKVEKGAPVGEVSTARGAEAEVASCSRQAEHVFERLGYKADGGSGNPFASYSNHFNARLGRCFMTLEVTTVTGQSETIVKYLFDAFEQRQYAEYDWVSSQTRLASEQPPSVCKLVPHINETRQCRTAAEYDDFVASYME